MTIMGQPDSVWRLIGCLWNLCVRYLLGFLKTILVRRLFVIVGRLIVTQNRKQGSAIRYALLPNMVMVKEARLQGSGTKIKLRQTNFPNEGVVTGSIPVRLSHPIIRRKYYG